MLFLLSLNHTAATSFLPPCMQVTVMGPCFTGDIDTHPPSVVVGEAVRNYLQKRALAFMCRLYILASLTLPLWGADKLIGVG